MVSRLVQLTALLFTLASLSTGATLAAEPVLGSEPRRPGVMLYFFSPDWRPTDLGKLTGAVEEAFAAGGLPVIFQAFTRYEDFERQIIAQPPLFIIAPSWIERAPPAELGLDFTVIARPVRRGKASYRKALMARPGIDSVDDLARGSIAATVHSTVAGDAGAILQVFHLSPESAKVVPVPKDVDALLALSFGQVDAALVTSEQYEILARTNPPEAERLRVVAFSPEVKLPPVFALARADAQLRTRLRDLLVRLPEVKGGPTVLEMLGFDRFVPDVAAEAQAAPEPAKTAAAPGPAATATTTTPTPPVAASKAAGRSR